MIYLQDNILGVVQLETIISEWQQAGEAGQGHLPIALQTWDPSTGSQLPRGYQRHLLCPWQPEVPQSGWEQCQVVRHGLLPQVCPDNQSEQEHDWGTVLLDFKSLLTQIFSFSTKRNYWISLWSYWMRIKLYCYC